MPEKIKKIVSQFFKIVLPLAFGILLFWLVYRQMDFNEIMRIIRSGVNFGIIGISLVFGLFANVIRGYRWNLLIKPLGAKPKVWNLVYAVLGNYVVNLVLPRLGEVWRCGIINRYEKIPFTKLLGTLIIDRLSDTISVAIIVLVAFGLNFKYFETFFETHAQVWNQIHLILTSPWLYVGIVLILLFFYFIFRSFGHTLFFVKIKKFLSNIWEGVKTVWYMKDKWKFLFYTLLIWVGYFCFFYICFYAFSFTEHLGFVAGLIAFALSSVAVAVPVQGGIGPWHLAVIAVLVGYGVEKNDAAAFAFIVHGVQTVFTAIVGLFGVFALPLTNKKNQIVSVEELG